MVKDFSKLTGSGLCLLGVSKHNKYGCSFCNLGFEHLVTSEHMDSVVKAFSKLTDYGLATEAEVFIYI